MAKFRFAPWLADWLFGLTGFSFEWDEANSTKNVEKPGILCEEAEVVFTMRKFIPLGEQYQPPTPEPRYGVLGETRDGKQLFLVFTLRQERIRVISARRMNQRERAFYATLREE